MSNDDLQVHLLFTTGTDLMDATIDIDTNRPFKDILEEIGGKVPSHTGGWLTMMLYLEFAPPEGQA